SGVYLWFRSSVSGLTPRVSETGTGFRLGESDDVVLVEALGEEGLDELGRRRGVDRQCHQRLVAFVRPRDGNAGDVDPSVAEERADPADPPGNVAVAAEDHLRRELEVELVAERRDEPLPVLAPDQRPGNAQPVHVDADQVREVARLGGPLLAHLDPT